MPFPDFCKKYPNAGLLIEVFPIIKKSPLKFKGKFFFSKDIDFSSQKLVIFLSYKHKIIK